MTPTQEPARAGEQMSENTKAVELPEVLFDGHRVWSALEWNRPGVSVPSPDAVSAVLDAAVRLAREDAHHLAQPAVPEGVDTESADWRDGFSVGRAESEYLCRLLKDPKCDRCGARNAKEAETLCRPSDDSCPGVEWPLERIWALTPQPAAQESDVIELLETRIQLLRSALVRIERGAYPVTSATAALDKDRAVALSTPQPESAQGERGAVDVSARLLDVTKAMRQHLALFCGPDDAIANELFRVADEAIAQAQLTTPTGEQNARVVGEVMHATQIGSHGDYSVFHWTCPGGLHGFLQRHPVGTKLYATPPAPVAQAGDGVAVTDAKRSGALRVIRNIAAERRPYDQRQADRLETAADVLASTQANG